MNCLWVHRIVCCQPARIAEDPFGPREPGLLFRLMEVMTSRYNQTNGHQLDSLPTNGGCIPRPDPGLTLHAGTYTPQAIIMPETVIEPYRVSGTHLIVAFYSNTSDLRLRSHQVRHCDKTQRFSFIFNEASRGTAVAVVEASSDHTHHRLVQHLKLSPAQPFGCCSLHQSDINTSDRTDHCTTLPAIGNSIRFGVSLIPNGTGD